MSVEQLKNEIDKNQFVDKNLNDFQKGKNVVDKLVELKDIDINVKYALLLYNIYKIKGGR